MRFFSVEHCKRPNAEATYMRLARRSVLARQAARACAPTEARLSVHAPEIPDSASEAVQPQQLTGSSIEVRLQGGTDICQARLRLAFEQLLSAAAAHCSTEPGSGDQPSHARARRLSFILQPLHCLIAAKLTAQHQGTTMEHASTQTCAA